jgi:hypothetical protein
MSAIRQIHWGRILLAGFLAEVTVMVGFLLLLGIFWLAGMPEVAMPMTPLDYVDALVASFLSIYFFTLWVGRRIESGFVLHGVLIGLVAMSLFLALIQVAEGSIEQPFLYWVAHGLKILGGITGGLVAERRRRAAPLAPAQIRT